MKLKLFFTLLLLGFTFMNQLSAQTAEGDWYTPLRNRLLHVTISRDSIIFSKCDFDSINHNYGSGDMQFKILQKVHTNYIVSSLKDSVKTYYLFGFTIDAANGKIYMNLESMNNPFLNIQDAGRTIPEFKKHPIKIIFLSKQQIDKIKQGKMLSSMTVNDFKKYAEKTIEVDSINATYEKKRYKFGHLYSESSSRLLLAEQGFNSLVKGDKFDAMLDKFYENPETQPLLLKMAGFTK